MYILKNNIYLKIDKKKIDIIAAKHKKSFKPFFF